MHEVALAEDLLEMVREELEGRKINTEDRSIKIKVEVGAMSCVVIDSFRFAFRAVSQDTFLADANLQCREKPLEIKCGNCGFEGEIETELPLCPDCESGETEIKSGDEFLVKTIEIGG